LNYMLSYPLLHVLYVELHFVDTLGCELDLGD